MQPFYVHAEPDAVVAAGVVVRILGPYRLSAGERRKITIDYDEILRQLGANITSSDWRVEGDAQLSDVGQSSSAVWAYCSAVRSNAKAVNTVTLSTGELLERAVIVTFIP